MSRARRLCVTFWNEPDWVRWSDGEVYSYGVIAKEVCPRTNKVHWHGYFEITAGKKKTFGGFKGDWKDNTCHIEAARGTGKEAREYVIKDGEVIAEWGTMREGQGHRSDLDEIKKKLEDGESMLDIATEHFGDFVRYHRGLMLYKDLLDRKRAKMRECFMPEVIVYLGASGSGKSHHCFNDPDFQQNGYRFMAQMAGKMYWDGYEGEETIWFDEFGGHIMSFGYFCELVDKWGRRVENKGGSVMLHPKKILISTIEWPGCWWGESNRFLADPTQLWRRLTSIRYCTDGEWVELDKTLVSVCKNKQEYDRLESTR